MEVYHDMIILTIVTSASHESRLNSLLSILIGLSGIVTEERSEIKGFL